MAIELSMLGAAHAAANPLTTRYGIIHGQAVGMMLPHVVRFNAEESVAREAYSELARDTGLVEKGTSPTDALVARLQAILAAAHSQAGTRPPSLADYGVSAEAVPDLAVEAAAQWTAQFNPRSVTAADFEQLYRTALTEGEG
jgi:alcohol dehydrogenase